MGMHGAIVADSTAQATAGVVRRAAEENTARRIAVLDVGGLSFTRLGRLAEVDERWRALVREGHWAVMTTRTLGSRAHENVLWTIVYGRRMDARKVEAMREAAMTRQDVTAPSDGHLVARLHAAGKTVRLIAVEGEAVDASSGAAYLAARVLGLDPLVVRGPMAASAIDGDAPDLIWVAFQAASGDESQAAAVLSALVRALREAYDVYLLAHPGTSTGAESVALGWWRAKGTGGITGTSLTSDVPRNARTPAPGGFLLTTDTTRWDGIVAAVDLYPTWLLALGIAPGAVEGAPLRPVAGFKRADPAGDGTKAPAPSAFAEAAALERASQRLTAVRTAFMPVYLNVSVGLTVVAAVASAASFIAQFARVAHRTPFGTTGVKALTALAAGWTLGTPLFSYLLGALAYVPSLPTAFALFTLWAVVAALCCRLWGCRRALAAYAGWLLASAAIDQASGYGFSRYSLFGYDPLIGARYYGLGNEYMGLVVGAALWWIVRHGASTVVRWAMYVFVFVLLAAPTLGANFGGTLAWLLAAVFLWREGRLPAWPVAGAAVLAALLGGVLIWHMASPAPSHLARLLWAMRAEGPEPLWEIAVRKAAMNARLVRHSLWGRFFVGALIVAVPMFALVRVRRVKRPPFGGVAGFGAVVNAAMRSAGCLPREAKRAAQAVFWVSVVNFLINDSGVVAGAMGLLFVVYPLLCEGIVGGRRTPGQSEAAPDHA